MNRPIKELLQILLEYIKENGVDGQGLCCARLYIYYEDLISWVDYLDLSHFIDDHRPRLENDEKWGWPPGELQPRIDWLKEHIKLNS